MIIYVKSGELKIDENRLNHQLNQARYILKDATIRTDDEDSDSKRVAEEWAAIRNIPIQHHGAPTLIIVPGLPACIKETAGKSIDIISQEAKTISDTASRIPGENLFKRLLNPGSWTRTVIWLGEEDSRKPPA